MSKKFIAAFLVLGLLVAFSGPAVAKKKKGPKPYTSEEATINVGHPVFYANSGTLLSATAQEFLNTCAIPQSNGVDAYVYEIPADYAKLSARRSRRSAARAPTTRTTWTCSSTTRAVRTSVSSTRRARMSPV